MLRKRILAAATASILALGMSMGGAGAAFAHHQDGHSGGGGGSSSETTTVIDDRPCNEYGYNKIDQESGDETFAWGKLVWDGTGLTATLNPGWTVDLCLKGGNEANVFIDDTAGGTFNVTQGSISHIGWKDPVFTAQVASASIAFTDPTCESAQGLNEDGFSATGATLTSSNVSGSTYTVVFTASSGFKFPAGPNVTNGGDTLTLTGELDPALTGEQCEEEPEVASASIAFTDPTCESAEALNVAGFSATGATVTTNTVVDGSYTVVFTADSGFEFAAGTGVSEDGSTLTFTGELASALPEDECVDDSVFVEPMITVTPFDCFFGGGFELPFIEGVIWSVDGEIVSSGIYPVLEAGTEVSIVASLDPAFENVAFAEGAETEWDLVFAEPEDGCDLTTLPLVSPSVAVSQPDCDTANGSYTLSATEGVTWFVNGVERAAGTYQSAAGTSVSIEAVANEGFGFGFEQQTEWNVTFTAATDCELPELETLALTGVTGLAGTAALVALLITLTGVGMVAARRRVEV